jgi:hypothetical protein
VVRSNVVEMIVDYRKQQRARDIEVIRLDAKCLSNIPRTNAGGIELLDDPKGRFCSG